jgi:hypothetical protein
MKQTPEINFQLLGINELLRIPISINRKRTLKNDAEEFIFQEAEVLPRQGPINLTIHLALSEVNYKDDIAAAIHQHFCYRREQTQKQFKRTLQYGWRILLIAIAMLAVIFSLTELALYLMPDNRFIQFLRESFIILGWVALWRPLELLLYDWYPVKTKIRLYSRLENSNVNVIVNDF